MENPFALFENLPKTFRVELIIDREKGVLDAQIFDATEIVGEGQEIVSGCDELNAKLEKGFRLVRILRPRDRPLRFLIER